MVDKFCFASDLKIIEMANESAFDALGEEFFEHRLSPILSVIVDAKNLFCYQSLSFSYPSWSNTSPATSLKSFLCSSVKYCIHPPVFPERKVRLFLGWIALPNTNNAFSRDTGI